MFIFIHFQLVREKIYNNIITQKQETTKYFTKYSFLELEYSMQFIGFTMMSVFLNSRRTRNILDLIL